MLSAEFEETFQPLIFDFINRAIQAIYFEERETALSQRGELNRDSTIFPPGDENWRTELKTLPQNQLLESQRSSASDSCPCCGEFAMQRR